MTTWLNVEMIKVKKKIIIYLLWKSSSNVKSSHRYLYSALYNADCFKTQCDSMMQTVDYTAALKENNVIVQLKPSCKDHQLLNEFISIKQFTA